MTPTVRPVHSDWLDRIREEPYKILGQASLACLRAFFDGYELGCARAGKESDLDPRLGRFNEWVAEKLGRDRLSVSGFCMIELESEDEARALNRFFELWDEYTLAVEPEARPSEPEPAPPIQIKDLDNLLAAIRRRPAMYMGWSSVTLLRALLQGYLNALQDMRFFAEESALLDDFAVWLCTRLRRRQGYRWDRLLLFFERNEAAALDAFFKYFAEFQTGLKATP
jgi:hypothetical protein